MQNYYSTKELKRVTDNLMETNLSCNIVYPEIYYKVQPFVICACDQMDSYDSVVTQEMLDQMGDNIYENVCAMYPELLEYANQNSMMKATTEENQGDKDLYQKERYYRPRYGRFRRRGIFRDFIDLLLFNQILRGGRGRRYYY